MGETCAGSGPGTCGGDKSWVPEVLSTKVAGQGSTAALEPGDWFSYELDLDLPAIPGQSPKRVEIELQTNDPDNGD